MTEPAEGLVAAQSGVLSFVIPAYNEEGCLDPVLAELLCVVDEHGYQAEVIVVDDGSTDGTAAMVRAVGARDPRVKVIRLRRNLGKSHALQVGLDEACGDVVVLMDADGQDDPHEIPAMLDAIDGGLDLVTGRRAVRRDRFVKRWTSRLYNWTTRRLTGVDGHDFNSGFKAMRGDVAESFELYGDLHRYVPVLAAWSGYRVGEIPVNHRPRVGGESKFGRARFWRGYLDLLTVKFLTTYTNRPLHLLGSIGTVLSALGFVILTYLSVDWILGNAIGTRPALTAGVLLVIVGIQLISLGLVAELIVSLAHRANDRAATPRAAGARAGSDVTGTEVEADPSVRPVDTARPARRVWQWLSGDEAVQRSTVLAWLALLAAVVFVVQGTVRFDFRDQPVAGDQTSYLLQALSLEGDGHNLSYDAADMDRWRDVGWVSAPTSLFFQRTPHGWAFAKSYGYSLLLAVFIALFGVVHGVAAVGTFLVLALTLLSIAILRTRYRGPVVPLAVLAFVVTSYVYFYAYVISEDLFLAVVTAAISLLILKAWSSRSVAWAGGAIALMVATIPEKPQFVALFAPMVIALLWRERSVTKKVALVVVAVAAVFVASFPYRHYSDGSSWNAYQGDRYFTNGPTPFDHPRLAATTCPPVCAQSGEVSLTSVDGIRRRIEQGRGQAASFFYYFFGRYTGVLVFIPFALLALGVVMILYWRRLDGLAWATLAGILGYILLNVVVYPNNYYGGGQSLGDRYFLQMAPFVLLLLVAAHVTARAMRWISAVGIALGVVFLLPHHAHPSDAYVRIDQTSPLQRLLPIEANQEGVNFFRCPIYGDCAATATKIDGFRP